MQLLGVRKAAQVADVGMHLACFVDINCFEMPCRTARNIPLAHGVFVSVCLVLQKNFGPKKHGRQLKG